MNYGSKAAVKGLITFDFVYSAGRGAGTEEMSDGRRKI